MAAVSTHKRRPVAPSKATQKVDLSTITTLKPETTLEAYHTLFMNIELLMNPMVEHGLTDEVITMVNASRLGQYARELSQCDRYLEEILESAKRWNAETTRATKAAEREERLSPEATMAKLDAVQNPRSLRPPEGGGIVTLAITARLSLSLPPSSASLMKAEQVYGPFWTIQARCFVVPKSTNFTKIVTAFMKYMETHPKASKRGFRLLTEYKVQQTVYRNVDIYMLVDIPRLVALRDTKIIELGLTSREQIHEIDNEERLPIIERAERIVARLPRTVTHESKRYMVHRIVEYMLLDDKRNKLRESRYSRDGRPKEYSAADSILAIERHKISTEIGNMIRVPMNEIHRALTNKTFSTYIGTFLRVCGTDGWQRAKALASEWQKLRKLANQ